MSDNKSMYVKSLTRDRKMNITNSELTVSSAALTLTNNVWAWGYCHNWHASQWQSCSSIAYYCKDRISNVIVLCLLLVFEVKLVLADIFFHSPHDLSETDGRLKLLLYYNNKQHVIYIVHNHDPEKV